MAVPLIILYGFLLNTYTACMLAFLPPAVKTLTPVLSVARDAFEGGWSLFGKNLAISPVHELSLATLSLKAFV